MYGIQRRVDGGEWAYWTSSKNKDDFEALLNRARSHQVLGSVEQLFMTGTTSLKMDRNGQLEEYRLFWDEDANAVSSSESLSHN